MFNIAVPRSSIGTDIDLLIRSIFDALTDPIWQLVHCDHSIAIKNSAVPGNANDLRVFSPSSGYRDGMRSPRQVHHEARGHHRMDGHENHKKRKGEPHER